MVIIITNTLSPKAEENNVIKFLDRLNSKAQMNMTSHLLFKSSFEYLRLKNKVNLAIKSKSKKDLKDTRENLKKVIYDRVKYKKLFKQQLQ